MKIITICCVALFFITSNCLALDQSIMCSKSFRVISTGDSLEQVLAACGPPLKTETEQQHTTSTVPAVDWIYLLPFIGPRTGNTADYRIIIRMIENHVASIETIAVGPDYPLPPCIRESQVHEGSSESAVQFYCGTPNLIRYVTVPAPTSEPVTVLYYLFNKFQAATPLYFHQNKLSKIGE